MRFGDKVLVYREKSKLWEGPAKFIWKENETVCVQFPHGRKIFRSNVVKPHHKDEYGEDNEIHFVSVEEEDPIYFCFSNDKIEKYQLSRKEELEGLLRRGVFEIVDVESVPEGERIYGTKFVDEMRKDIHGNEYEKSRLVAQNFRDIAATQLLTKSPTISRMAQRTGLCIMTLKRKRNGKAFTRDIKQAYTQSEFQLERVIYLWPVQEMNFPEGKILRAVKPLYGIPESGLHWFLTYQKHHIEYLGMTQSTVDRCMFFKKSDSDPIPSLILLQVDDSVGCGDDEFLRIEEDKSTKFLTKPREFIDNGTEVRFNGSVISHTSDGYSIDQKKRCEELMDPSTEKEATSTRAKIQYISTVCRPDLASFSQLLASDKMIPDTEAFKQLLNLVEYARCTAQRRLNFVDLDQSSLRLMLFTDSAFGNRADLSSQLGYVIVLSDKYCNANILHYGSQKCRRITRSPMAAELLGLSTGFDESFCVKHLIEEMLGITIPLDVYIDSRTTFNCVAKNSGTTEKRLQIDAASIRQAISRGEINTISWISGKENPAGGLTRATLLHDDHPLVKRMMTNKIDVQGEGWMETSVLPKEEKARVS